MNCIRCPTSYRKLKPPATTVSHSNVSSLRILPWWIRLPLHVPPCRLAIVTSGYLPCLLVALLNPQLFLISPSATYRQLFFPCVSPPCHAPGKERRGQALAAATRSSEWMSGSRGCRSAQLFLALVPSWGGRENTAFDL